MTVRLNIQKDRGNPLSIALAQTTAQVHIHVERLTPHMFWIGLDDESLYLRRLSERGEAVRLT